MKIYLNAFVQIMELEFFLDELVSRTLGTNAIKCPLGSRVIYTWITISPNLYVHLPLHPIFVKIPGCAREAKF